MNQQTPPSQARETADIETASDGYASRFAGPVGEWMLSVQERIVARLLSAHRQPTILDVGGGHGQLAIPLGRQGYAVTVLGSDESCGRRIAAEVDAGRCRFVTGDVLALPFADRSFDLVLSFRLLPHCGRWEALIAELCRVARAAVIVDYPVSGGLNRLAPALFEAKKRMEGNTRTWRAFRDAEVAEAFARSGFGLASRNPQFFLPMVLHRKLRCRPISAGAEAACRAAGLTRLWGSPVIVEMRRGA